MKIIDISVPLKAHMPVYPRNPEVGIESVNTGHSTISKITLGSHAGTHYDAPSHVSYEGKTISDIKLDVFYGPCRVLDLTHIQKVITIADLEEFDIKQGERILAKTRNSEFGFDEFTADYVYIDGNSADYMAEIGITLFGIDYMSVKEKGSIDNRPHTSLLDNGVTILEYINLKNVPPGDYTFVGFPLPLEGLDGAPARCVLLPRGDTPC